MTHPLQAAVSALDTVDWPIVRAVTDAAAIGIGGILLRMVWKSYEKVMQLHAAIYGDPDDPHPNGIKRDLSRLKEEQQTWRENLERNMTTNADRLQRLMSTLSEKVDTLSERRRHPR